MTAPSYAGQWSINDAFGIDVSTSGHVFVTERGNNIVRKFDLSGNLLLQWGGWGSGNGQLNMPNYVAVDNSRNILYVADQGNNRVQVFSTTTGAFVSNITGITSPSGVAVDSLGNLYVSSYTNQQISKYDSSGSFIGTIGSFGTGSGQFRGPMGMTVDSRDYLYVADHDNNRVLIYNDSGVFLASFGTSGSSNGRFFGPTDIAISTSNIVYVFDLGNRRIQIFDLNGTYLAQWGVSGSGNGQFGTTYGIAVYLNTVYVAEKINNRVQYFQ